MKIYYVPFNNTVNSYSNRMKELLSNYGEICAINPKAIYKKIILLNFKDVILLNWIENMIINTKGGISIYNVFKLFFIVLLFRMIFTKVVYVRHNHYPHSCAYKNIKKAQIILDIIEKICHITLVHSPIEENKLKKYIPHPLYKIDTLRNNNFKSSNLKSNDLVIFGSISRYKKIENVINIFPNDLNLIIMGSSSDNQYLEELKVLIRNRNNIKLISNYVSDEMAESIITNSAGLLITHNDDDMIVSGSFFYAMSIGGRVFCLETPFFKWAENTLGTGCVKSYKNLDSLFANVRKDILSYSEVKIEPILLFGDRIILNKLNTILID